MKRTAVVLAGVSFLLCAVLPAFPAPPPNSDTQPPRGTAALPAPRHLPVPRIACQRKRLAPPRLSLSALGVQSRCLIVSAHKIRPQRTWWLGGYSERCRLLTRSKPNNKGV